MPIRSALVLDHVFFCAECVTLPSLLQITDTEHTDHVISLETQVESLGITGKALYYHLNRVLEERDVYIEVLIAVCRSAVKYGDLVTFLCFDVYV